MWWVRTSSSNIERADGRIERHPALAAELARLKVDLIVAVATPGARAAQQATTTIPIVGVAMGDPVRDGLVASLARPGANVTGSTFLGPELVPKRLELFKEPLPSILRVAVLWHPGAFGERTMGDMLKATEATSRTLGVRLQLAEVRGSDDLDRAFSTMIKECADALFVLPSTMLFNERRRIVVLAAKNRLPSMFNAREFVELGGLMGYGASILDLNRRAATYLDKILRGRQAGRSARRATDEVRAGHQPQGRQGARPDHPPVPPTAGGSGDRVVRGVACWSQADEATSWVIPG